MAESIRFSDEQLSIINDAKALLEGHPDKQRASNIRSISSDDPVVDAAIKFIKNERFEEPILKDNPDITGIILSEERFERALILPEASESWDGIYLEERITRDYELGQMAVGLTISAERFVGDDWVVDWAHHINEPIADETVLAIVRGILDEAHDRQA